MSGGANYLPKFLPISFFRRASRYKGVSGHLLPRPICRNVLEDFCCLKFGGFSRGFSWRIFLGTFPTKMRRKNPARKSAKKSGGSKMKIREKSVLPKAGPNIWPSNKENPSAYWHANLSCPLMASNDATSYLVSISFWMADHALESFFYQISLFGRASRFIAF